MGKSFKNKNLEIKIIGLTNALQIRILGKVYKKNYLSSRLSVTTMGLTNFAILILKHWISMLLARHKHSRENQIPFKTKYPS